MNVRFIDKHLEALEADPKCNTKWDHQIVRGFRKVMGLVRAAIDERAFYAMKSLHYEKMEGALAGLQNHEADRPMEVVLTD